MRGLREQGVAILYVSHRLGEVEALADRVAVLRDGRVQAEFERPLDPGRIVEAMLGELVGDLDARAAARPGRAVVRFEGARLFDGEPAVRPRAARGRGRSASRG